MVTVSSAGPTGLFKGMTTTTSDVIARFPLLLPVRNPVAGYGASAVTRTRDRGHVAEVKNQFHGVAGSQSGFPKKPFSPLMSNRFSVSSMNMLKTIYQRCVVRMRVYAIYFSMRLGDAIDPCHLANGFEAVISYECQERRANPLSVYRGYKQVMQGVTKQVSWWGGVYSVLGTLWMPLFGESFLTVTEVIFVRAQVFTP